MYVYLRQSSCERGLAENGIPNWYGYGLGIRSKPFLANFHHASASGTRTKSGSTCHRIGVLCIEQIMSEALSLLKFKVGGSG